MRRATARAALFRLGLGVFHRCMKTGRGVSRAPMFPSGLARPAKSVAQPALCGRWPARGRRGRNPASGAVKLAKRPRKRAGLGARAPPLARAGGGGSASAAASVPPGALHRVVEFLRYAAYLAGSHAGGAVRLVYHPVVHAARIRRGCVVAHLSAILLLVGESGFSPAPALQLGRTPRPSGPCREGAGGAGCCSRTARSPAPSSRGRAPWRRWR